MKAAVNAGWMVLLVWSIGWLGAPAWAQDGWPEDPPGDALFRPDCGDPPPEVDDPSPGDGNDCWEYRESEGWVQMFECIEEIIECPEVTCEPVPSEGCACLKIGDSETFTFTKPKWTVGPGLKEIKPDNPDCGDAREVEFHAKEEDSWEVSGGEDVVTVSPRKGNGDAEFTATAIAVGEAALAVTWRMTLTMDENCPKEFSEPGPTASVGVYEKYEAPDPPRKYPDPEYVEGLIAGRDGGEGFGDNHVYFGHNIHCVPLCEEPCSLCRLEGTFGIYNPSIRVVSCIDVTVDGCISAPRGSCKPRSEDRKAESLAHEQKHLDLWYDFLDEWNEKVENMDPFVCDEANNKIEELLDDFTEAKNAMSARQGSHCPDFDGDARYDVNGCGDEIFMNEFRECD